MKPGKAASFMELAFLDLDRTYQGLESWVLPPFSYRSLDSFQLSLSSS